MRGKDLNTIEPLLKKKLQEIEKETGDNLYITSALRSSRHNKSVGGAENSNHLDKDGNGLVWAVDIARYSFAGSPEKMILKMNKKGINGCGIYDDHIHVDIRSISAFWDKRTGEGQYDQVKKVNININDLDHLFDDKINDLKQQGLSTSLIASILLMSFITLFFNDK